VTPLEKELEAAMLDLYERWKRFGPAKNIFLRMVKKTRDERLFKGPVGTVRYLLAGDPSSGFKDIIRAGHMELTVEALILQPKWKDLFDDWDSLCQTARARIGAAKNSN
jgi:hypothetical protein